MSTPNQPQDPYQPQDPKQPSAGGDGASGAPQYGQYSTPGGTPGGYQPYPPGQPYGQGQPPVFGYPKNNLAVWSLILGIAGVIFCGPAGIAAVIIGGNAKKAVARGEANNGGMATAGIVLGWVAIALLVIYVILGLAGVIGGSNY